MKFSARHIVFVALLTILGSGCLSIVDSAVNSAARSTGDAFGNALGRQVGDRLGAQVGAGISARYSPMMVTFYTSYMFGMAFGSGGYAVSGQEYEEGEFTRWSVAQDEKGSWMERALLKTLENGNQWWRVKLYDGESGNTSVLEALFDETRSKLLRLRAKFPQDEQPQELPVTENQYYAAPGKLTSESLEGAKVGPEKVTVPAGTFDATLYRYGSVSGGTWDWWLTEKVPGGLAKYRVTSPSEGEGKDAPEGAENMDRNNWELVLQEYGTGAKSELGIE